MSGMWPYRHVVRLAETRHCCPELRGRTCGELYEGEIVIRCSWLRKSRGLRCAQHEILGEQKGQRKKRLKSRLRKESRESSSNPTTSSSPQVLYRAFSTRYTFSPLRTIPCFSRATFSIASRSSSIAFTSSCNRRPLASASCIFCSISRF